tara:strand:+ start:66 stop:920 length:855 start_codon:yes stop_codon:yes gene_type:complete
MFKYLRNLRHKDSVKDLVLWNKIGAFYRYVIGVLPFNFSVNQFVTKNFKFQLHARFAFSNFKNWGNKHNDFFPIYLKLSESSKCFFDVGAHIGIVSLAVSKSISSKGKIFAFEASKLNIDFLKYHIKSNNIKNIKVINKLVTSTVKKDQSFFESNEVSGMNSVISINEKQITQKKNVQSTTLDEFCEIKKIYPDILKVDIEGSEIDMLIGAKGIIKKMKPLIFLSYHPFHIKKLGYDKSIIFDILRELDYKIYDSKKKIPLTLKNSEYLLIHKRKNLNDIFQKK